MIYDFSAIGSDGNGWILLLPDHKLIISVHDSTVHECSYTIRNTITAFGILVWKMYTLGTWSHTNHGAMYPACTFSHTRNVIWARCASSLCIVGKRILLCNDIFLFDEDGLDSRLSLFPCVLKYTETGTENADVHSLLENWRLATFINILQQFLLSYLTFSNVYQHFTTFSKGTNVPLRVVP